MLGRPPVSSAYGWDFWLAYVANALTMVSVSLLVRYADFVSFLGGNEGRLGLIVGFGMIGSLAMRLAQGTGIDHYGPRAIWLWSLALYVASLLLHLTITTSAGPGIYLVRVAMQTGIAGIFGASITYISRRVPPERMAEIIGTLGTSGFVGLLIGPQLGDRIMGTGVIGWSHLQSMFLAAAGLGTLSLVAAWGATRREVHLPRRRQPSVVALVKRYHPGPMLLVAAAVGIGISVPNTFLRPFAEERSISQIGLFFTTYGIVAIAVRLSTRHLFQRWPNRVWVLGGLASMAFSIVLYLSVRTTWQLILPGVAAGVAHALLFPSVVAGGSTSFPARYRGLGTTLMLAMFDLGALLGAPAVGGIVIAARGLQIPAYPTMFLALAVVLASIGIYFARHSASNSTTGKQIARARRVREQHSHQQRRAAKTD